MQTIWSHNVIQMTSALLETYFTYSLIKDSNAWQIICLSFLSFVWHEWHVFAHFWQFFNFNNPREIILETEIKFEPFWGDYRIFNNNRPGAIIFFNYQGGRLYFQLSKNYSDGIPEMAYLAIICLRSWLLLGTFLPKVTKISTIYVGYHIITVSFIQLFVLLISKNQ